MKPGELVVEISIVLSDGRMNKARKLEAIKGVLRKHHLDMMHEQDKLIDAFRNPGPLQVLPPTPADKLDAKMSMTSRWDDETELRILALQSAVSMRAHGDTADDIVSRAAELQAWMAEGIAGHTQCDHRLEDDHCIMAKGHENSEELGVAQFHVTREGVVFGNDSSDDDMCDYNDGVEDCVLIYGHEGVGLDGYPYLGHHINKYGKVFSK